MTHISFTSCPSLLQHCSQLQCRAGGYPAWHFTLLLWSRASHARRELVRAVGLRPLLKWSHCTEAGSKRYINNIRPRNGMWPPACVTSLSGRASWPGDPGTNPQGAGADRPYLLLSTKGRRTPTAPHGVRPARTGTPGRHAETRSLRSDQPRSASGLPRGRSLPDRAHNYDQQIRLALTETARGSVRGPGTGGLRREQAPVPCTPRSGTRPHTFQGTCDDTSAGPHEDPLTASSGRPSERG